MMKNAVLAIDATRDTPQTIERLSYSLIRFQRAGLFENLHVASVIHPDSYLLPIAFYRDEKHRLAKQSKLELKAKLDPQLKVSSVETLVTENSAMGDHIDLLGRYARSVEAEILIVGSQDRSALSYLVQGSFAESASLKSPLPVMVLGGASGSARVSRPPTVLVALDPAQPPGANTRRWIVSLAMAFKANISLVPLADQSRWLSSEREVGRERAESLRREFAMEGILSVNFDTRELVFSSQVPSLADQKQALITVFCATPATLKKPWFAPSLNGRVIADMSRPIIVSNELFTKEVSAWSNQRSERGILISKS
jgi:nucleotide-binding universal stress UspA family protein